MRENVLERYPGADLRVYAVWLPMLATDSRGAWDEGTLPDRRVHHYWDAERVLGLDLAQHDLGGLGYAAVVWDAYFLFDEDAIWIAKPAPVVASGSDVIGNTGPLAAGLRRLLAPMKHAAPA